ncbi:MAG: hypothetical protein HY652_11600 [Acidobacteria bacterium]|nr:hypothetical protein [Acidobacteriota bacterium]
MGKNRRIRRTSGDSDMEYLSDGITDSLINGFSQVRKLRVVPRSLVFRYKGRDADPQAAGRHLNVRAVLTGRVTQRGDVLSIGAELLTWKASPRSGVLRMPESLPTSLPCRKRSRGKSQKSFACN